MTSRLRAVLLIFGSLAIALAVGTWLSVSATKSSLYDDIDNEIDVSLETTAVFLNDFDLDAFDGIEPTSRIEALTIIGPDDAVVAYLPAGPPTDPMPAPNLSPEEVRGNVGGHFTVAGTDSGPDYRVGSIELEDRSIAAVARPLDEVQSTLRTLGRTSAITSLGVLMVLGIIIWWILRSSLRPIEEMIDTAQTIAEGDYSRRADMTKSDDEVGRLGTAINTMLDQIETSFARQQASETRLKRFVSDASHELRTPLTTVKGYSEVYLSGAATDDESVTKQMTRINAEATRMGILVDDLLTLARLDQGRGLVHKPVDLMPIIEDSVADAKTVDAERSFSISGSYNSLPVLGDEDKLRQVFSNLLGNTHVHTAPGTTVVVTIERTADHVAVAVVDDGPGLSPENAEVVFDRFFRAEESRSRAKGGAGLGLAISKAIVEAHGGDLTIDTAPGVGSTFVVTLPAAST